LGDPAEAEDQVQHALRKAFEHFDQYLGDASFLKWLRQIVVNQCLVARRCKKRAPVVYINFNGTGRDTLNPPAQTRDPEDEIMTKDMIQVLRTEIRHSPPLFRQVILLRDIDQRPIQEVARHLGITPQAAKSRLKRARDELRRRVIYRVAPGRAWQV